MEEEQPRRSSAPDRRQHKQADALPQLALTWLRDVLKTEFPVAGFPQGVCGRTNSPGWGTRGRYSGASNHTTADRLWTHPASRDPLDIAARFQRGDVEHARWCRDWHRQWQILRLPLQFSRFVRLLNGADSAETVFGTLAEHAVRMVGGYTCLIFPDQEHRPLRPVSNPVLRTGPDRLMLTAPVATVGTADREEVVARAHTPLSGLEPLFSEERATSVAYAPLGTGGVVILVERRHGRIFEATDQHLLRLLASHAAAALSRVQQSAQIDGLAGVDVNEALPGPSQTAAVLAHALAIAEQGEALAVARLHLAGLDRVEAEDGKLAAERILRTAADVLRESVGSLGVPLPQGQSEFLLVLPRSGPLQSGSIAAHLQRQLPARIRVFAGVAVYRPGEGASELLARATETLSPVMEGPPRFT